ncbi:MAG: hypothetical protein M3Y91_06935 [Actinomycetota bacterium]|nr:hypothetical protein [Actinomycetota bacterium]
MTITTARLALPEPQPTDQPNGPAQIGALAQALDSICVVKLAGLLAARPAPAVDGRFYETTDAGPVQLFYDTGSAWITIGQGNVVTAKGDLVVGIGPQTVARLGVGADGQVLVARSTSTDGVDWEVPTAGTLAGSAAITTYTERLVTLNPATSTPSVDLTQGNEFALVLNANATVTVVNVPSTAGVRISLGVTVTQPSAGGPYTVTWPASFDWGGYGVPPLSGAGKTDEFGFVTDNGGGTWRAHLTGPGF